MQIMFLELSDAIMGKPDTYVAHGFETRNHSVYTDAAVCCPADGGACSFFDQETFYKSTLLPGEFVEEKLNSAKFANCLTYSDMRLPNETDIFSHTLRPDYIMLDPAIWMLWISGWDNVSRYQHELTTVVQFAAETPNTRLVLWSSLPVDKGKLPPHKAKFTNLKLRAMADVASNIIRNASPHIEAFFVDALALGLEGSLRGEFEASGDGVHWVRNTVYRASNQQTDTLYSLLWDLTLSLFCG